MTAGDGVLIAAYSGRALAAAARRAGYAPLVADLFADEDTGHLAAACRQVKGDLAGGFDTDSLLESLERLAGGGPAPLGFVYGAGFEARPTLLGEIAGHWPILGNTPEALARVKEPESFAAACSRLGIPHPEIRRECPARPEGWLRKRAGGAGGAHVVPAADIFSDERIAPALPLTRPPSASALSRKKRGLETAALLSPPPSAGEGGAVRRRVRGRCRTGAHGVYFQRRVEGRAVSALFAASRGMVRILGFSEQWPAPTADEPYRFGGAVRPASLLSQTEAVLTDAVHALAGEFGLRGLNSADFLVGESGWWLLEVNPRPGATLDIFDSAARPLFALHLAAVSDRPLPSAPRLSGAAATRIVYAPRAVAVPPGVRYPEWTADRPRPGVRLRESDPFCTVLAREQSACEAVASCARRAGYWLTALDEHEEWMRSS